MMRASATGVAACTAEPLSVYLATSSYCEIGYFLFGGFYYVGRSLGSGTAVPADQIMVTPILSATGPGLEFSANWSATGNGGNDSEMGYHVDTISGLAYINEADMAMSATVSGVADARLDEYLCPGGDFTGLCTANPQDVLHMHLDIGPTPGVQTSAISFGPVSTLSVIKDVRVYGIGQGVGAISDVTNQFPAPEPAAAGLCLAGLAAIWGFRKRTRRR